MLRLGVRFLSSAPFYLVKGIIMVSIRSILENFLLPGNFKSSKRILPTRPSLPFRKNVNKIKKMNSKLSHMRKVSVEEDNQQQE